MKVWWVQPVQTKREKKIEPANPGGSGFFRRKKHNHTPFKNWGSASIMICPPTCDARFVVWTGEEEGEAKGVTLNTWNVAVASWGRSDAAGR
jgi:hypothetical protein